jgi:uncharacterized membrane protein
VQAEAYEAGGRTDLRIALAGIALFVLTYCALDLNKLYALRYGADLGTFLQTIVNMGHGSSWNFGEWRPHLEVHDSWILFFLVPLVALFPRAETLIVIQVLVVAAAAIPLALFARELGLSTKAANLLAVAYLLSPASQGFTYDNFSENVFVPLLAFSGAYFARRHSLWATLLFAQLLMGVKEDEILFAAWFALPCLLFWDRRMGLALLALAVLNGAIYWGTLALLGTHSNTPQYSLAIEDVSGRLTLVALLLAPFAFSPLFVGRWLLLAIPPLAEIVFAQRGAYEPSRIGSHYAAPLLACTAIAAAFGLSRRPRLVPFLVPCALFVMLFVFNDSGLRPGRWPFLVDWNAYDRALAIRNTRSQILLRRRDEGVWAVAASNPLVRLDLRPDPGFVACPGYNTNPMALLSALGVGPKMKLQLCGGVPITQ